MQCCYSTTFFSDTVISCFTNKLQLPPLEYKIKWCAGFCQEKKKNPEKECFVLTWRLATSRVLHLCDGHTRGGKKIDFLIWWLHCDASLHCTCYFRLLIAFRMCTVLCYATSPSTGCIMNSNKPWKNILYHFSMIICVSAVILVEVTQK